MRYGVSTRTILALTAAAPRPVGRDLCDQLRFGGAPGCCQDQFAPPGFARPAKAADVVDAGEAFRLRYARGSTSDRSRSNSQLAVRWSKLSGRVQCAQRCLLPRPKARQVEGGPSGRPDCPGRGGFHDTRKFLARPTTPSPKEGVAAEGPPVPTRRNSTAIRPRRKPADSPRRRPEVGMNFGAMNYMIAFSWASRRRRRPGSSSWAATISPSTSTTRERQAPRPLTTSLLSRRCGTMIRGKTHEPLAPMRITARLAWLAYTRAVETGENSKHVSTMSTSALKRTVSSLPGARGVPVPSSPMSRRISSKKRLRPDGR